MDFLKPLEFQEPIGVFLIPKSFELVSSESFEPHLRVDFLDSNDLSVMGALNFRSIRCQLDFLIPKFLELLSWESLEPLVYFQC